MYIRDLVKHHQELMFKDYKIKNIKKEINKLNYDFIDNTDNEYIYYYNDIIAYYNIPIKRRALLK